MQSQILLFNMQLNLLKDIMSSVVVVVVVVVDDVGIKGI